MIVSHRNTYTTGIVLVHGYLRIDVDLVLPKVRAQIESECTLIAKGLVRSRGEGKAGENGSVCICFFCFYKSFGQMLIIV